MHPIWSPPSSGDISRSSQLKSSDPSIVCSTAEATTTAEQPTNLLTESFGPVVGDVLRDFRQVTFPTMVEQQYEEILRQLRMNPIARSLVQAENLVIRLEKRCEQRLNRLKALYSLVSDSEKKSVKSAISGKLGQMETISEEIEIDDLKLDEDEFPIEDDNFDDDDDEDDDINTNLQEHVGEMSTFFPDQGYIRDSDKAKPLENDYESAGSESDRYDEVDEDDDDDGEEDEDAEPQSSEDELVRRGLKPAFIDCPEDAEFVEAFEKMTAEAMLSASNATASAPIGLSGGPASVSGDGIGMTPRSLLPALDILNLSASKTKQPISQAQSIGTHHAESLMANLDSHSVEQQRIPIRSESDHNSSTVPFKLVVKKANRPHVVQLAVPTDVQFAALYIQREAAEKEEKARMKKLVLEMHEAQKVADETEWGRLGSDVLLSLQVQTNVNRDRGVKYTHPKGAPDVDAVFGSSSTSSANPSAYSAHRTQRR